MNLSINKDIRHRIAYFMPDNGGCSHYRGHLPMEQIEMVSKHMTTHSIEVGEKYDRIAELTHMADVVLMQRIINAKGVMKLQTSLGKPIIVDYDDCFAFVSPYSIHYNQWGLEEPEHILPDGKLVKIWRDGEGGFDIERNKNFHEKLRDTILAADAITVTTQVLADYYRQLNANVYVLPNCLDLKKWKPLPEHDDGNIYLFWAGAASHYPDVVHLQKPLEILFKKYKNLHLKMFGTAYGAVFQNLPPGRIHKIAWEQINAYPYKMMIEAQGQTIGLIPLDHVMEFNKYKSNLKYLEYSALNIPSVMTYTTPYKEDYDGENAVVIEDNDPDAWVDGIEALIKSKELRIEMGKKARATVEAKYDIAKRYKDWEDTYIKIKEKHNG